MNKSNPASVFQTQYDRSACATGIVHIGYGAFHRAHQAVYVDDYMDLTGDLSWGIAAVNLRAAESDSFAKQAAADGGYVLKSVAPDGASELRRVRSHLSFYDWQINPDETETLFALNSVHMVTITVTESGYYLDNKGALNPQDPMIKAEVEGGPELTVYAYLSAAISRRMAAGGAPLTILCCDNIRQNGKMLQTNLMAYLALTKRDAVADWVAAHVTFPCSMVDRITPRATDAMLHDVELLAGPQSAPPVVAEAFYQWVLENNFAGPMPSLDKADVIITADVDPYEETKIRILNGGHTALCYLAALHDIETFDAAMSEPDLLAHFDGYEQNEVLPGLTLDLPFDKGAYLDSIRERFGNSAIADTVARICADGMAKFPLFIRPTLESCLQQGIMPHYGLRSVASWYVFSKHVAAGKIPFRYIEPSWDQLSPMLTDEGRVQFVRSAQLWGDLPNLYPAFIETLTASIIELETQWPV